MPPGDDVAALRSAFAGFPSGVVAIAAAADGVDQILVASSFTVGVSQDPPLVMFAVQHSSGTWPTLRTAPVLGVSLLGERHETTARQLSASDRSRRFDGLAVHRDPSGAILLAQAPAWLTCTIWATHPAGDHDIVVLRVEEFRVDPEARPLLWYRSALRAMDAGADAPAVAARPAPRPTTPNAPNLKEVRSA